MTHSQAAPTVVRGRRSPASASSSAVAPVGLTIYGCGHDEAALFEEMAPRFGVVPTITEAPVSDATIGLALGNRCISIGHKTHVSDSTLLALSHAGVTYIGTRSIGCNHLDATYAASVGIAVDTVAYSPASVADYTLMLILMAVRDAQAIIRRADGGDYRLADVPGRELRDLTVGVVGVGRIGAAVIDRLRGFGCRTLAYDVRPKTPAEYVGLGDLLSASDVVTLHPPLTAETHHLIDRHRIAQMKRGAYIVNTGRGALIDTDALIASLESGRLGGAALDVLEGEEGTFYADCRANPRESQQLLRLRALPNVLISPHTAYYTDRALRDIVENTLTNCLRYAGRDRRG